MVDILTPRLRVIAPQQHQLWCNMALAYENLPPHIKDILHELEAVHDLLPGFIDRIPEEDRATLRDRFPAQTHPVVRTPAFKGWSRNTSN